MDNNELNLPGYEIPDDLKNAVSVTTLDRLYNWGRRSSVWPLMFGLACCAIEMIAAQASRYDLARFGMEVMRPTPRQADLMLVAGTVTKKMLPAIVRLYNQMPEPKYVVAMGACASSGGPFKEGYNVVAGIDKYPAGRHLCARLPAHPASPDEWPDHAPEEDRQGIHHARCAGTARARTGRSAGPDPGTRPDRCAPHPRYQSQGCGTCQSRNPARAGIGG